MDQSRGRHRSRGATRVLALLAAGALIASGCGSSSGSGTTAPSSPRALSAVAARELDRLASPTAFAGAQLNLPSNEAAVDRRYLTELFDDAQRVWRGDFASAHLAYRPTQLVLYWSKTDSGCGRKADSGPFYCPADRTVYLDLRFLALLRHQHGLGRVAEAFIVAHEVAHHVQQLLGISRAVALANDANPGERNARSVKLELEADCLAGVWASSAYRRSRLSAHELNEGLRTAQLIGDDYLARARGRVVDSALFTHGSSEQRQEWLRTGFRTGRPEACNTFTTR